MFKDIQTERLLIRSLQQADAEILFAYRSHPEVLKYQSWHPKSLAEVRTFIDKQTENTFNNPGWYQIGIANKSDSILIGDIGIHFLERDDRQVEFGITISPAHQSHGYASEAVKSVLNHLFSTLKKHRVIASVDPLNIASIALMKHLKLRQEAHFRQSIRSKEGWTDDAIFAMLASDWKNLTYRQTSE